MTFAVLRWVHPRSTYQNICSLASVARRSPRAFINSEPQIRTGSIMADNPTADRPTDETYQVALRGTGTESRYSITAEESVAYPEDEAAHERIQGRTATGTVAAGTDVVECTGPITALRTTEGEGNFEVVIDDQTFAVDDFPDTEAAEPVEETTETATFTIGGTTYEVRETAPNGE